MIKIVSFDNTCNWAGHVNKAYFTYFTLYESIALLTLGRNNHHEFLRVYQSFDEV